MHPEINKLLIDKKRGGNYISILKKKIQELEDELISNIDPNKIKNILSKKNKMSHIYFLCLQVLLLTKPDLLVCIIKYQIHKGLKADQVITLNVLTTYLNECKSRHYF
jgi:transcriptional regulator CtsR